MPSPLVSFQSFYMHNAYLHTLAQPSGTHFLSVSHTVTSLSTFKCHLKSFLFSSYQHIQHVWGSLQNLRCINPLLLFSAALLSGLWRRRWLWHRQFFKCGWYREPWHTVGETAEQQVSCMCSNVVDCSLLLVLLSNARSSEVFLKHLWVFWKWNFYKRAVPFMLLSNQGHMKLLSAAFC